MLHLNGQDGGGQILRTALTLSMLTGQAFHIKNIRGRRRKPGLMRQHLTCVKAAAEISNASTDGAELHSTELIFNPESITPGDYHFSIGTAGSTTLLAQTLIPALLQADAPSSLTLEGGTHNPLAPSACYIQQVFLPQLKRMGAEVSLDLKQHGFAPAGGGKIVCQISPCNQLTPLHLTDRGTEVSRSITCHLAHIGEMIAERELTAACKALGWPDTCARTIDASDSSGSGNCLSIAIAFDHVTELATAHGAFGKSSEKVARLAAKHIKNYLASGAVVGHHLADQLLLPMALAGEGSMIITTPTNHQQTNIRVIRSFLGDAIKINISTHGDILHQITITS